MSSPLLVRPKSSGDGALVSVTTERADWSYIGFRVMQFAPGATFEGTTGADELAIVVVQGCLAVESDAGTWNVGQRPDPFSGPAEALYLPPNTSFRLRARTDAEAAFCSAPAREPFHAARLLRCSGEGKLRGAGHAERRVYDILMDEDAASTLFITEVLTFPGNWSSYPPHKHDRDDPPVESQLEELYYYRMRPASGFAFQSVYTLDGDLDETIAVHDRDVVLVPRGYHVCAAAPEYTVYYLNVLAGPKHVYHMTFDPAHEWIKKDWTW